MARVLPSLQRGITQLIGAGVVEISAAPYSPDAQSARCLRRCGCRQPGEKAAMAEVKRRSGIWDDPELVEALLRMGADPLF